MSSIPGAPWKERTQLDMCFRLAPTTMTHCRALCPEHTHCLPRSTALTLVLGLVLQTLGLLLLPAHVSCCRAALPSPALCSAHPGDSGSAAPIPSSAHRQQALVLRPLHPSSHSKIPPHSPGCQTPGAGGLLGPRGTTRAGLWHPCAPPAPLSTQSGCPLPQHLPRAHCHLSCHHPAVSVSSPPRTLPAGSHRAWTGLSCSRFSYFFSS